MTEAPFVLETLYLLASAHGNVIVNLRSGVFCFVLCNSSLASNNVLQIWSGKIATETGFQQRHKYLLNPAKPPAASSF